MIKTVNDLLHREMSRREFISTLGLALASIVGFSSLIKLLDGDDHTSKLRGYGSSAYGGAKRS